MRVLAVDPGPHVGMACWEDEKGEAFTAWEWTPDEFQEHIESWVAAADVVVVEDFNIGGARGREANQTIEMVGVVRFLARRHGRRFVPQQPGAYRPFAEKVKLDRLGWYTVGSDHARSATGHLVKFLAEARLIDRQRLL